MSTTDSAVVNSRSWWEDYFASQWDSYDGRAQTAYFMRLLVEGLPFLDRQFLASHKSTVLDWGCAFGNGVDVLVKSFPKCRVTGMDFAERAILEARRCFPDYDFRHTENGDIGDQFDVIVTSNCLEHFADPLSVVRQHLACCRCFYVAMVPYREAPLHPQHTAQFREECFPSKVGGFTRLAITVTDCQSPYWQGQQLLVVYGALAYRSMRLLRSAASRLTLQGARRKHVASMGWQALHGDPRPLLLAAQLHVKKAARPACTTVDQPQGLWCPSRDPGPGGTVTEPVLFQPRQVR